jgi:phage terminase large subunit
VIQESRKAFDSGYRIIVNQGGTRSGKTFSLSQYLIYLAFTGKYSISTCSVAFPHLRKGAMRDWRKIMEDFKLYDPNAHMKTEQLYTYPTGSYVEFFSVDNQLKVRGPGRDILFINECNIIQYETFRQLLLRTKKCIFLDYNPADEFHWIYDKVLTRPDCYFIKSTYKDNPFLPQEQINEIESYKEADPNFWRIYGEGERGHSEGVIYFGYQNPTSLIKVTENEKALYWSEEIYQSHLTNQDLIGMLRQIVKGETIYCDSAEPDRIEELKRAGFKAVPANKDVKAGIDFIKSRKLFVHQGSVNLLKEIKSYKFKPKGPGGKNEPEEPLKLNDHAMDAARYGSISFRKPKNTGLNMTFSNKR